MFLIRNILAQNCVLDSFDELITLFILDNVSGLLAVKNVLAGIFCGIKKQFAVVNYITERLKLCFERRSSKFDNKHFLKSSHSLFVTVLIKTPVIPQLYII